MSPAIALFPPCETCPVVAIAGLANDTAIRNAIVVGDLTQPPLGARHRSPSIGQSARLRTWAELDVRKRDGIRLVVGPSRANTGEHCDFVQK
ncbi:hypothetical protein LSAT2_032056 [Lamellibrachia satsuma]|nr:hypothetical protein LSAT2_032056 [Lamellibrachia satsuma]